jgi:hypothetical protein
MTDRHSLPGLDHHLCSQHVAPDVSAPKYDLCEGEKILIKTAVNAIMKAALKTKIE